MASIKHSTTSVSESMAEDRCSVTAPITQSEDARAKARKVANADKYAVGICRALANILRVLISSSLVRPHKLVDLEHHYCIEMKRTDLGLVEKLVIGLIVYLRRIFESDEKLLYDCESAEVMQVKADLRNVTTVVNNGKKSLLYNKTIPTIQSAEFILTRETALELSHALMDQLLVNERIPNMLILATRLKVFSDHHGNNETSKLLTQLYHTWKRIDNLETHEEFIASDAKAYGSLKSWLSNHHGDVFDHEMMKQFPDYEEEIRNEQVLSEKVKRCTTVFELKSKGNMLQKVNCMLARGAKITPQILTQLYLGLVLCKWIDGSAHPAAIDYNVLLATRVPKRNARYLDPRQQQEPQNWNRRVLTDYQAFVFGFYRCLKTIPENFNIAANHQTKINLHIAKLRRSKTLPRKSEFYESVVEEYERGGVADPRCGMASLVKRLRVAVLHELLVEMVDGLGDLLDLVWFDDKTDKNDIWCLLSSVNECKHSLGVDATMGVEVDATMGVEVDATTGVEDYLQTFERLVNEFFAPELAGLYSAQKMMEESEECAVIYKTGCCMFSVVDMLKGLHGN